jgi:predicted esterase
MFTAALLLVLLATSQAEPGAAPFLPGDRGDGLERGARQDGEFILVDHDRMFLALFSDLTFTYTGRGYRDRPFRYRLFVPETAGPGDKRPLLVWLHGRGESGDDISSHLRHLSRIIFKEPSQRERYPFFLLAVQCPRDNSHWTTSSENADDMLNVVIAILEETLRDYPVDASRVSLSGISSGGSGAWELAVRRPELFSCVAPIASGGADPSRIDRLKGLPVWAFHSTNDSGTPVHLVRSTVAALQRGGGTVHLTEISHAQHDCWTAAFEDYELLSWLLSQKRGDTSSPSPGSVSTKARLQLAWKSLRAGWTPAQLLAQIGIPLLLIFAVWSALRQRRLSGSGKLPACRSTEEENKRNTTER